MKKLQLTLACGDYEIVRPLKLIFYSTNIQTIERA